MVYMSGKKKVSTPSASCSACRRPGVSSEAYHIQMAHNMSTYKDKSDARGVFLPSGTNPSMETCNDLVRRVRVLELCHPPWVPTAFSPLSPSAFSSPSRRRRPAAPSRGVGQTCLAWAAEEPVCDTI